MQSISKIPDRKTALKSIYVAIMCIALISFVYMMAMDRENYLGVVFTFPVFVWIIRIISILPSLLLMEKKKNIGFILLMIYFLWFFFRMLFTSKDHLFTTDGSESILAGTWLFVSCFLFGGILSEKQIKWFLRLLAGFWTIWFTAYSMVGLYAAWTGQWILSPGRGAFWGIYDGRLMLIYLETVSGALLSLSILIALCALIISKKTVAKVLYGLSIIPMITALSLTDSRTALITLAVGTSAITFILVVQCKKRSISRQFFEKKRIWGFFIAVGLSLIVFLITVFLAMNVSDVYNSIRTRGGILVSQAFADSTGETTVINRGFQGGSSMFAGRVELWESLIRYLFQNPLLLLTGTSKVSPMGGVTLPSGIPFAHCHNLFLQVLLESGLPGLLLLLAFIVYTLKCSIRLIFSKTSPLWLRLLPAICISILAGELVECFIWLKSSQIPISTIFFITAGIICAYGGKKAEKLEEAAASNRS